MRKLRQTIHRQTFARIRLSLITACACLCPLFSQQLMAHNAIDLDPQHLPSHVARIAVMSDRWPDNIGFAFRLEKKPDCFFFVRRTDKAMKTLLAQVMLAYSQDQEITELEYIQEGGGQWCGSIQTIHIGD